MIGSYRNRPVQIEAMQWDGSRKSEEEIMQWALPRVRGRASGSHLILRTTRGESIRTDPGDWIVRDSNGRFSMVTAVVFAETYEPVTE
jgi:hypothetical protein